MREYHLLFLQLQRMYHQLGHPVPSHIHCHTIRDTVMEEWINRLRESRSFLQYGSGRAEVSGDEAMELGDAITSPAAPPPTSAFDALMRKLCEREGLELMDHTASSSPFSEGEVNTSIARWEYEATATDSAAPHSVALIDFTDDVFALHDEDTSAVQHPAGTEDNLPDIQHRETSHSDLTEAVQQPPPLSTLSADGPTSSTSPLPPLPVQEVAPQPMEVQVVEEASAQSAMAAMQSLLSAVLSLQYDLADLQGPLSGQLNDDQLRCHPSLLPLIPHVDALHAMSTAAFTAAFSPPTNESALTPASLPTKLLYLLIRLLLTSSTHHNRACLIVTYCMSHVMRTESHRDVLLAVSHVLSSHPAAVFSSLLTPLLTSQGVTRLTSSHLDLVRHCIQHTSRTDLTQSLLSLLCQSLTTNATPAASSSLSPLPSAWALEIACLLMEAVPPSGEVGAEVVGMVVAGGKGGWYVGLEGGMQIKHGRLLKLLVGKCAEECRRRRGELIAACQPMSHFSVKKTLEKLASL